MLDLSRVEYRPYYLVNAIEVNGGPFLRAYLSSRPEVDRILDSQHLRPLPAPVPVSSGDTSAPSEPPWNITSIGADRVWKELGITGKGIVVGHRTRVYRAIILCCAMAIAGEMGRTTITGSIPGTTRAHPATLVGTALTR